MNKKEYCFKTDYLHLCSIGGSKKEKAYIHVHVHNFYVSYLY